jgi:hypothetical protein
MSSETTALASTTPAPSTQARPKWNLLAWLSNQKLRSPSFSCPSCVKETSVDEGEESVTVAQNTKTLSESTSILSVREPMEWEEAPRCHEGLAAAGADALLERKEAQRVSAVLTMSSSLLSEGVSPEELVPPRLVRHSRRYTDEEIDWSRLSQALERAPPMLPPPACSSFISGAATVTATTATAATAAASHLSSTSAARPACATVGSSVTASNPFGLTIQVPKPAHPSKTIVPVPWPTIEEQTPSPPPAPVTDAADEYVML